jgi:hypothetical protein
MLFLFFSFEFGLGADDTDGFVPIDSPPPKFPRHSKKPGKKKSCMMTSLVPVMIG